MAVIRQRRQNVSSQIGVIRADTGEAAAWRSAGEFADTIIEQSFNELKREAKRKGIETAQAASAANLRAIDPKTGKPIAFQIPNNFGKVAQDAYEEIIERRYITQTETDFKQKATELAIKYEFDPDGVAKFSTEMGKFIEVSSENAAPKFANIINNIGSALLASNKLALTRDQALRTREELKDQVFFETTDAANNIASLYELTRTDGTTDTNSESDGNEFYEIQQSRIEKAFEGSLISGVERNRLLASLDSGKSKGLTTRIITKIQLDPNTLSMDVNDLQRVLQSNGSGIEGLPQSIQEDVKLLLGIPTFSQLQDEISRDLSFFQQRLSTDEANERFQLNEQERVEAEQERQRDELNQAGATSFVQNNSKAISDLALNGDYAGAVKALDNFSKEFEAKYLNKGLSFTQVESFIATERNNLMRILTQDANKIANTKQMIAFADYIEERGTKQIDLPPELKSIADTILRVAKSSDDFVSVNALNDKYVSQKVTIDNRDKESESVTNARSDMSSGVGTSTNSSHRKVMENDLFNFFNVPPENKNWWFTDQGFSQFDQWSSLSIQYNVIPESISDAVKTFVNGKALPFAPERVIETYARFSEVRTIEGGRPVNMWNGVLKAEEQAIMESAIQASAKLPEGARDLVQIVNEIRAFYSNPEKRNLIKSVLGDETIDVFVERMLIDDPFIGSDVKNINVFREMKPVVEYLIAGGADKRSIESTFKRIYDQHYLPTEGIVADPVYGPSIHRSAQSLMAAFPQKQVRRKAVSILNNELTTLGLDDYRFQMMYESTVIEDLARSRLPVGAFEDVASGMEGAPPDVMDIGKKKAFLVPFRTSGTVAEDVRYIVMEQSERGVLVPLIGQKEIGPNKYAPTMIEFSLDKIREAVRSGQL